MEDKYRKIIIGLLFLILLFVVGVLAAEYISSAVRYPATNILNILDDNVYTSSLNFRFKIGLYICALFLINYVVYELFGYYSAHKRKFKYFYSIFPIVGFLLGATVGYLNYPKIFSTGEVTNVLFSHLIVFSFKIIFVAGFSIMLMFSFAEVFLLTSRKMIKFLMIFFLFIIGGSFLIIFGFLFITTGETTALLINHGQIAILKRDGEFAAIRPLTQRVEQTGWMEYEWYDIGKGMDIFEKTVFNKGLGKVYDSESIKIKNIEVSWSPHDNHSGFIYPGRIEGNLNPPIKIVIMNWDTINNIDLSILKFVEQ